VKADEAAEYLRCDRQRIYDLVSSRRLTKLKDGSRVLLFRAELDEYVASSLPPRLYALAWRQVSEARNLREAQAQPFVVVDFDVNESSQAIRFRPDLRTTFDDKPNVVSPKDLKIFHDGIPSLPPGKRLAVMVDMFPQRDEAGLPDLYHVQINFFAPALGREMSDATVIDLGIYRDVRAPPRHPRRP
jgi:excisionase family DNA binding protein